MVFKRAAIKNVPLWSHQSDGVSLIREFIKGHHEGSALINMPTGTGKTGIIAVSSQLLRSVGNVLIVAPRLVLRRQLAAEINGRFFEKLGLDKTTLRKQVVQLERSTDLDKVGADNRKTIWLSTFQLIDRVAKTRPTALQHLARIIDLVIIDEGHYEPAPSWRDSLSLLNRPTVALTATPYRNDLKVFNVDHNYVLTYTLARGLRDRVVRPVEWHARTSIRNPAVFVDDIVHFMSDTGIDADDDKRVMIRAESPASIRHIADQVIRRGFSCVAIHETFSDSSGFAYEKRTVPDPTEEGARFWIHQFKLLEGFDDPRFSVLALYDPLYNGRQLVQQVGRVLRNPDRQKSSKAYALDHSGGVQEDLWNNYVAFDQMLDSEGVDAVRSTVNLVNAIQQHQPSVVYIGGRFRPRFELTMENAESQLRLTPTVNIFRKGPSCTLQEITNHLRYLFMEEDRPHTAISIDRDTVLLIYISFRNSSLLKDTYFLESRLGAALVHLRGRYVFYHDSSGGFPDLPQQLIARLEAKELRHLFRNASYLSSVSLRNSDIGRRAIRRRSVAALNLSDIAPAFDDHGFVCTTATGYSGSLGRRYIGFDHGRVSDLSAKKRSVSDYIDWVKTLSKSLESASGRTALFDRFAEIACAPDDTEPRNILLDISELQGSLVTTATADCGGDEPIDIPDQCVDVASGQFSVVANGQECAASISFRKGRYHIDSAELDRIYRPTSEVSSRGIVAYLNSTQSFRVIPNATGSFYTLGEFYEPAIKFGPRFVQNQTGVIDTIECHDVLSTVGSEKGVEFPEDRSGWDPNSLFGLTATCAVNTSLAERFGNPDILVCDDMATEVADFILADCGDRKRVVFIHAKAISTGHNAKEYGASGIQDVCAQASKNLGYLKRFSNDRPSKVERWHSSTWNNGRVRNRVRKNTTDARTGLQLWKHVSDVIRNPFSHLEVWLLLGRILSKDALIREASKNKPAPEAQQALYLLQATMTAVASIGGRLRVLCSP